MTSIMICECLGCKKKTKLMSFKCKCGKTFCIKHRLPETHNCTFTDFVNKDDLKEKLECKSDKLTKI